MNHIDHWSLTPDFSVSDPSDSNFHLFPLRFGSSLFSISQKMHPNDGGKNWQGEARLDGGGVRGWWGFRERYIWLSPTPQHCRLTQIHFSLHLCWHFFGFLDNFFGFIDNSFFISQPKRIGFRYIWLSPTPQHCRPTQIHFPLHLAPFSYFFWISTFFSS